MQKRNNYMATQTESGLHASDLPVVQYLNQRITFDLLATLEDGISQVKSIETQFSDSSSAQSSVEGGVKAGFGVPLFGITLGGNRSSGAEESELETTKEELVHTSSSLFARLRSELHTRSLIHKVSDIDSLSEIREGHFVEFEATLHRIQIIEILDAFTLLLPLGELTDSDTKQAAGGQSKQRKDSKQSTTSMLKQVKVIQNALSGSGSQDLVAKVGEMSFVLTVEDACFIDPTMNDILDGTFRVFGKVTRKVKDDQESVNLLRRSPLGKFLQVVQGLAASMNTLEGMQFEGGTTETSVFGPTLQVIPIAVFA